MRDWQLAADGPLALRLAADVRLGETDYADDQIWELVLGGGSDPALALQTRYGGRCKLARIIPTLVIGARNIVKAQGYAQRPVVRAFAPNYLRVTARPLTDLALTAEFWAMDSHAVGCRWTFTNESDAPVDLHAELGAAVTGLDDREVKVSLVVLESASPVLRVDRLKNITPVLAMEGARMALKGARLSRALRVPAGGRASVRWIHAGMGHIVDAIGAINYWLFDVDWDAAFAEIAALHLSTPDIQTGDPEWDAAIAFAYKVALQSYVGPTGDLPHPSFIFTRIPSRGYSLKGDGSDHNWQWDGQGATEAYVNLPAVAPAAPELAKGVIRNWLAVREPDGWIDWKPGLRGQRNGRLCIPLLATIAWMLYEYDEDRDFIAEVFPGLLSFFERWFAADMDRDGDGFPEWQDTIHSAFDDCPTFVRWRRWGQGADIRKYECPDLGAYLYREARSLREMAVLLGRDDARGALDARMTHLAGLINAMWRDATSCYHYQDRDSGLTTPGVVVGRCKGDEELIAALRLENPNRALIRITGGVDHAPTVTAFITGMDHNGAEVEELIEPASFYWYRGFGTATSRYIYQQIDAVRLEGLSRVYDVEVRTVDSTRIDQTLLLPLWAGLPGRDRAEAMVRNLITNPDHFWRRFGMPNCPASDPNYDPSNREGSGGVWMMWNTMLGEALLDYGYVAESATLFSRIMAAQLHTLKTEKAFREAYNADAPEGLGDVDHIRGVTPLHWLMRLIGVRIVSPRKVWTGGRYALPWPVTVTHRGVTVTRSATQTTVEFPSGSVLRLTDDTWQAVEDPHPPEPPPPQAVEAAPQPTAAEAAGSVRRYAPPRDPSRTVRVPINHATDNGAPESGAPESGIPERGTEPGGAQEAPPDAPDHTPDAGPVGGEA
ncbi:MAG: hypothetical protein Kow00120_22520 [Anaerolineae bacterium]